MDLEDLLVSLYVPVDEWWQRKCPPTPRKLGRPLSLSHSEVLTLAILAQWPAFVASATSSASPMPIFALAFPTSSPTANSTVASAPWSLN